MTKGRNKYTFVHIRIFLRALNKGKISFRKIWNWAVCCLSYFLKRERSAASPFMASIELWNECNADCLFCRDAKGVIYDINPNSEVTGIEKGRMSAETAKNIIDQLKDRILIAVLYTNGEPLIYTELPEVIQYATDRKVATMIATNGLILNETRARNILKAGLDFIKIQLSGYTQDIYSIQIRKGNVEKLKENIRNFVRMNKEGRYGTVILVDYILYEYNKHQLPLVREFCHELGVMLNTRPGNPAHGLEDREPPLTTEVLPLPISCDWLWKGMQINWNGDVLQCCEGIVHSSPEVYARFELGQTRLLDVWNSKAAATMRRTMAKKGREGIPLCSTCVRKGISFKW